MAFLQTTAASISSGGTINGNVTIAGDLTVQGDNSGTYSEIITGVLQMSSTTLNGSPINLLSRDTAIDTDGEGVRIRFGKSNDGFLADYGYRRWTSSDKGATITSTDNLRFALAGQDVSHFMFKGGNSTTGSILDIRPHEYHVVADDVLGKITFSAAHETSGTDAILAGAEIKALATAEFTSSVNSTDLIFGTGASEAATEKMRITSAGRVGIGTDSPDTNMHIAMDNGTMPDVSGEAGTGFIVQNNSATNDNVRMSLISGNAASGVIHFGDEQDHNAGTIYYNHSSNYMAFETNGANERLRIDSSGNVGIGRSDSVMSGLGGTNTKLTLYNSSYAGNLELAGNSSSDDALMGSIWFSNEDNADDTNVDADSKLIATIDVRTETSDSNAHDDSGSHIIFKTKPEAGTLAEAMRIDSSGRVGIGVAPSLDANTPLSVQTASDFSMLLNSTNDGGYVSLKIGNSGDTSDTSNWDIVRANGSGNLGFRHWNTFYSGGTVTTVMQLDKNCRISLSNNDSGGTGGTDSTSGNTIFGYHAGLNLDSGSIDNILIGHASGKGLSGSTNDYTQNVLIGGNSGRDITQGDNNVVVGHNAGRYLSQGDSNTLIGHNAGNAVLNANNNTIVGANAGDAISSGANNSILGTSALSTATTALNNVFIGRSAGEDIPASQALNGVIAIGWESFKGSGSTTTGPEGTVAIGYQALTALTTGIANTAIGYEALKTEDTSDGNVAIGHQALKTQDAVDNAGNTAVGYVALTNSTTAIGNTAVGYKAGQSVTTGGLSTIVGHQAGKSFTVGRYNTVLGYAAMDAEVEGSENVAIGYNALTAANAGGSGSGATNTHNTMVGANAGDGITSGIQNTGLGANVAFDVDANNQTAIGFGATTDSANDIAIGNTSVDEIEGQASFATYSDERIKQNIQDGDLGLDFINLLKPRKYNKVNPAKYPDSIKNPSDGVDSNGDEQEWTDAQANKVWDGLIAQEVKEAMDACETSYSGWREKKNSKQVLEYETLVVPLIKAVQELSARVEELESK